MSYAVEIGKNIVALREAKKISQEELALESDLSVTRLRDIEHGRANPSLDTLESLAKTLNMTLPHLLACHLDAATIMDLLEEVKQELNLK